MPFYSGFYQLSNGKKIIKFQCLQLPPGGQSYYKLVVSMKMSCYRSYFFYYQLVACPAIYCCRELLKLRRMVYIYIYNLFIFEEQITILTLVMICREDKSGNNRSQSNVFRNNSSPT